MIYRLDMTSPSALGSPRTPTHRGRWLKIFVLLLLASGFAFAVGVGVERSQIHTEATTAPAVHTETGTGEGATHTDEATGATSTTGGSSATTSSETLLGVNPESVPLVVGAVALSLVLAAAAWWRPSLPVLLLGAVFCLGAAALDVREVAHQLNENRSGLASLATFVAALHLAAFAAALAAARSLSTRPVAVQPVV